MAVFNSKNKKHHTKAKMFLDPSGGVNVQRFDVVKYKQFEKLTEKQLGFFWRPEEVDILKDAKDFKDLTDFEQHIFCLLYTSPSPRDRTRSRMPSSA